MSNWPYSFSYQQLQEDTWQYWLSTQEYVKLTEEFVKSEKFMRGLAIGAGVAVVVASVAGPYFYTSVPDGLYPADKWTVRRIHARLQFSGLLARIGTKLGFGKPMELNRRLRDRITTNVKINSNIFAEKLEFDGVPVVLYRKSQWNVTVNNPDDRPNRRPAIIHIYGGGWSFGNSKVYEPHHRLLTEKLDAVVLTIDYRKSPENVFPIPFDDCYTAVKYFHEHAEDFEVDEKRISIMGDSAGGNLAAAVALKLRDEGLSDVLKSQLLIYPCTQFVNFRTNSYLGGFPLLRQETMPIFSALYSGESPAKIAAGMAHNYHVSRDFLESSAWSFLRKYVPQHPTVFDCIAADFQSFQKKALNPYMCPLMAKSMRNLPPTLVMICQFDVLKDDALAYMDRLQADGVPVSLKVYPGVHSTFRYFEELKVGKEMMHDVIDYFRANM